MPRDEPTEDIIRREISAARRIIREDKIIAAHQEAMSKLAPPEPKDPPKGTPPAPDPRDPAPRPARRSLWWGEESD